MVTKIAIVPFVTIGRNAQVGRDGHLNFFKKSRTTVLKENLEARLNNNVEIIVDVNHGDIDFLEKEGVDCFLIPEDVATYIDFGKGDSKSKSFILSLDEYNTGNVERFISYLKGSSN